MVTTWELHYAAPRCLEDRSFMLEYLGALQHRFTEMCVDFLVVEDGGISVMIDGVDLLKLVLPPLSDFGPLRITSTVSGPLSKDDKIYTPGGVRVVASLTCNGEEQSSVDFYDLPPSEF